MSHQERWDVALVVLDGPLKNMNEQVLRGPLVRIGSAPGPGGLQLAGYRGLERRHAVITAHDQGTATITPVGSTQVRMAPHQHVSWAEIDPMSGPQYLSEGCALHLGPVNRGCTLRFEQCRKLGLWQAGDLASSPDTRRSSTITASKAPFWFLGCFFLMAMATVTLIAVPVLIHYRNPAPLGPIVEGSDMYDHASTAELDEQLLEGLEQGLLDFVMQPNADAADKRWLKDPGLWDEEFVNRTAASLERHLAAWAVFRRLDAIVDDYALVTREMRAAGLPDVMAAIPYQESRYRAELQSHACAKGYWQFMPEVANRVGRDTDLRFAVKDCALTGVEAPWSPTLATPGPLKDRAYISNKKCRIDGCRVDHRTELEKSTRAAAFTLKEAWEDADIAESGAAVQIAILSHNAGYHDSRFGQRRVTNLRPAYLNWRNEAKPKDWHHFYGDNITCETPDVGEGRGRCGSALPAETQHYAYTIVAQHLIAVCYYGLNYSSKKEFRAWEPYTRGDGYCTGLGIPTAQEVQTTKKIAP